MDSKQKSTEDKKFFYEINENFFENSEDASDYVLEEIIIQVLNCIEKLPIADNWIQSIAGVIDDGVDESVFFVVSYLKEKTELPLLVSLEFIDLDTYLDYILIKQTIKFYSNEQKLPGTEKDTEQKG